MQRTISGTQYYIRKSVLCSNVHHLDDSSITICGAQITQVESVSH